MADTRRVIRVAFEYEKSSCSLIACKPSKICQEVEKELRILTGTDARVFTISSRNRAKDKASDKAIRRKYFILQQWMKEWNMYFNIDSLEQVEHACTVACTYKVWDQCANYHRCTLLLLRL